ncbi:GntR family transcriptional regulator [Microbacterium sp. W4I20]|jgi:DNA-binding GntR family transcriptional regulator|uniref:GntR family transcriptional regulator n=1 Tax=Microbacterium sp. W4I20 TaxID=3042262 RepID=UPI00277FF115|nr:GntR family transcriptional regulator [Microbacterium sp. W4I20]MDQ0728461.1 DNA-binding GntR family transcriptional regulator [Microbacterium sp. W4I20]
MENLAAKNIGESKQLLAEEVFHHIGSQIVEGTLGPGQRIRDLDVAEQLHVSRTPVREALQRLERLGMVMMYPSRYTEVTEVTSDTVAQSLAFGGYQAGIAARLAVPRLTAPQRQYAAKLIEQMYDSLADSTRTMDTRWAVFAFLGEHSGNAQHCVLIEENTMALLRNLREWTVPVEDRERMLQIYVDFREAVLRGDGIEAERLTRAMHYV